MSNVFSGNIAMQSDEVEILTRKSERNRKKNTITVKAAKVVVGYFVSSMEDTL
jgi:hypothetical protein